MNTQRYCFALIIGCSLALAGDVSATPPRTHSIRGEVVAINAEKELFVLRDERTREETVIRWKSHSRFTTLDGRAGSCCLNTGTVAKVSFRREIGEKVAREVRWSKAACK
jgi:hypothetical protein